MRKSPSECVRLLMRLRDEYSEEMPEEKVETCPATHKVQVNWFKVVDTVLHYYASEHFSPDVRESIVFFRGSFWEQFSKRRWTTAKDIRCMNDVINVALWDLFRHVPDA